MRKTFILSGKKIFQRGSKKPLKFKKILTGSNNNYQLFLEDKTEVYIKENSGYMDYAELISKQLCDILRIPCAKSEVVSLVDFFEKGKPQLLQFSEYVDVCRQHFGKTPIEKLRSNYVNYLENYEADRYKRGIMSYGIQNEEPYKSAKVVPLSAISQIYFEVTKSDEIMYASDQIIEMLKAVEDEKNPISKKVKKMLGINKKITVHPDFELELKKVILFAHITCNWDLSFENLRIAFIKVNGGYSVHLAPLFDNERSFNLVDSQPAPGEGENTTVSIWMKYAGKGKSTLFDDDKESLSQIAEEIVQNDELAQFYNLFKKIDIERACDGVDYAGDDFSQAKEAVVKLFKLRLLQIDEMLEKIGNNEADEEQDL